MNPNMCFYVHSFIDFVLRSAWSIIRLIKCEFKVKTHARIYITSVTESARKVAKVHREIIVLWKKNYS